MDIDSIVIFILAAMLAVLPLIAWYVVAQRRRAARRERVMAALRRKQSESWERLRTSAAGAP